MFNSQEPLPRSGDCAQRIRKRRTLRGEGGAVHAARAVSSDTGLPIELKGSGRDFLKEDTEKAENYLG